LRKFFRCIGETLAGVAEVPRLDVGNELIRKITLEFEFAPDIVVECGTERAVYRFGAGIIFIVLIACRARI